MNNEDGDFIDILLIQFEKKIIYKYLGDIIISYYKKKNPSEQSMWCSDISRLTYIVNELYQNKKCLWNHDYKGAKVKDYLLLPLINHFKKYVNNYIENFKYFKLENKDLANSIIKMKKDIKIVELNEELHREFLIDDILKYITPSFTIDIQILDAK